MPILAKGKHDKAQQPTSDAIWKQLYAPMTVTIIILPKIQTLCTCMLAGCMLLFFMFSCFSVSIFLCFTLQTDLLHTASAANLRKLNQPEDTHICVFFAFKVTHELLGLYSETWSCRTQKHGLCVLICFCPCLQKKKKKKCPPPSPVQERAGILCPNWKCVNKALIFTIPKEEWHKFHMGVSVGGK